MRDFRDAKAMAHSLRAALADKTLKISNSESLELIAKAFGVADWNTLSAAIRESATKDPPASAEPSPTRVRAPGRVQFSSALEATLHRAVASANQRKHQYATLEHLLLVLIDDPDAASVMMACAADLPALRASLVNYIDVYLTSLIVEHDDDAAPTQGFQRVIQRAVIHVQASGGTEVTGGNILVAIFSEPESHAAIFLHGQGMTRAAAVNVLTRGDAKTGGDAAA